MGDDYHTVFHGIHNIAFIQNKDVVQIYDNKKMLVIRAKFVVFQPYKIMPK